MSESSQNPARTEYIASLRELADWLEQHPGAPTPTVADIQLPLMTNAAVEEYGKANGLEVRFDDKGNAHSRIKFGSVEYHAYGYADWDQHIAEHQESRARAWADENDMVIQPRDGGDVA